MPVRLVSQEELPGPLKGYRLIERLGRGGFGEVWKVEAPGGLLKAAKFVFGDLEAMDEESRPAEQELKALKRVRDIRHPYVLSLERFDTIDGQLIIVMELADRNLWDRFRECRSQGLPGVPREELISYMLETAEALDLMNSHYQIQHLDIKPQNLFLVFNHVKVGDFGLAKLMEGARATVTGGVTPVYAAPETFEGWISRFSDQYSLAIVFQELLTGTRPFNGANTRQLLMQHINGTPELNSLPMNDRPIIARALSKKPEERWPTCSEMVRGLKLAGQPVPVTTAVGYIDHNIAPQPGSSVSGMRTMLAGGSNSTNDSEATRMALGRSGPLGSNGAAHARVQTPQPGNLPPLIKPIGSQPSGINSTPMPTSGFGLRLVTPSTLQSGQQPALTLNRPMIFQTGRMGSMGIAPPEKHSDGALFPALIVALGQTGRTVVESLKRIVCDHFVHPDRVPNIRFLYIDTDPESVPATPPDDPAAFTLRETVLARLHRPAHYLQRDSLPPIDPWMPPGTLYKLARTPGAANGVRAFGRLALFDNYRLIAQRVRQEIETFLTENTLNEAEKNTKLGLRSNRPRAYIVSGLAGGTGSGMFLDLAFLLRHELRQVGYLKPEVIGLFLTPTGEKNAARTTTVANTYAALTELHHFQARHSRYQTAFDRSEAPITDSDPPFARIAILPHSKTPNPKLPCPTIAVAARSLYQEILTPTGRVADEMRDVYRNAYPVFTPSCQTFGLFRLNWPRAEMLAAATRRFAQRQIQRWTAKEATHLREPIAAWLTQQWEERKLSLDTMVETLTTAVRDALREDPERVFDAFVDPLRTRTPSSAKIDAAGTCAVLDQLIKVVGKPDCENDPAQGSLHAPLTVRYEHLCREAEGHLAVMAATFLEVPQFRLPGAEEALRQIGDKLKLQVDALEPVRVELSKEVRQTYGRLFQVIGSLSGALASWKLGASAEILELLRIYPRKRLQLHILDMILSVYRKLLGNAPEYLREINYCRTSLADMHAQLAKIAGSSPAAITAGKLILPDGCKDLDGAADQFLAGLEPEALLAFEQALQKEIARKFRGLGNVCLKPNEKGPLFRELLINRSREFLDGKLDHSNPAAVFFRFRPEESNAEPLIAEAFDEAAPELTVRSNGEKPYEIALLAVPPGPEGDKLRQLAAQVLPAAELIPAPLPDDICFYREYPQLNLADVPQLGDLALEAYQQMAASEHPPHTRMDVAWQPATSN